MVLPNLGVLILSCDLPRNMELRRLRVEGRTPYADCEGGVDAV